MERRRLTKRTALIVLVIALVLFGLGAGLMTSDSSDPATENTPTATETPTDVRPGEPTVSVTPPETTTTNETTTPTSPVTPSLGASMELTASSPDDVANDGGHVGSLWGSLSGSVTWSGPVDDAVLVVSVLSPNEGWVERQRVTVHPDEDSLSLQEALDASRYRYLHAHQATGFNNPDAGTTYQRVGAVSITAVLFSDGEERARVVETESYRFDVTNTGGIDISLTESGTESAGVGVNTDNGGAVPGETANRTMTVTNDGEFTGTVSVYLQNVRGSENGFADPELAADGGPGSELLEWLEFRVAVGDGDDRRYVLGGPSEWVDLNDSLSGKSLTSFTLDPGSSRSIVVEWHIPVDADNAIMTDTADWDVEFVFESDGSA